MKSIYYHGSVYGNKDFDDEGFLSLVSVVRGKVGAAVYQYAAQYIHAERYESVL